MRGKDCEIYRERGGERKRVIEKSEIETYREVEKSRKKERGR